MGHAGAADFRYTVEHFKEIARRNRFPENARIEHQRERCLICHPERADRDPFRVYLAVVVESVLVRRPRIDEDLVAAVNSDLELMGYGDERRISLESLEGGDPEALSCLGQWLRNAIDTGLELLSIHSPGAREFNLEEMEAAGYGSLIAAAIDEIVRRQRQAG